jgi:hypothetical protein
MNTIEPVRIPAGALVLGLAGVIPFAACAGALWLLDDRALQIDVARALAAYGAVILSFIGGVRWGAALRLPPAQANSELVLAVIPSLLGWCALLLPGPTQPLLALWLGIAVFGILDVREGARGTWPRWYSRQRLILTLLVLLCLTAGVLAA